MEEAERGERSWQEEEDNSWQGERYEQDKNSEWDWRDPQNILLAAQPANTQPRQVESFEPDMFDAFELPPPSTELPSSTQLPPSAQSALQSTAKKRRNTATAEEKAEKRKKAAEKKAAAAEKAAETSQWIPTGYGGGEWQG